MRSQDRYLLNVPARFSVAGSTRTTIGNTMDMNEKGVRIRCDAPLSREELVDQDVIVEIETGEGWVRFEGCVRRIQEQDIGIRFYSEVGTLSDRGQRSVDELIPISAPTV